MNPATTDRPAPQGRAPDFLLDASGVIRPDRAELFLRFAGQAMQGYASSNHHLDLSTEVLAEWSYQLAAEMVRKLDDIMDGGIFE